MVQHPKISKLTILELSRDSGRFLVQGIPPALANSLRRSMIGEIPKFAVDEVSIYANDSVLFDEILGHRLGMIPLRTKSRYRYGCDCGSKGCPLCQASLILNVEGPKMVYSGDLVPTNPDVVPTDPKLPIVNLKPKQRIYLEAVARIGKGKFHAKWQPVVACGYKQRPLIKVDRSICDNCGNCVRACLKHVLKLKRGKLELSGSLKCNFCRKCMEVCERAAIRVEPDKFSYVFRYETDGSIPAHEIPLEAARMMINKLEEFITSLEKLELERSSMS